MFVSSVPHSNLSGAGFPSECLELVPDQGFRWLCGDPVPDDVRALLRTSQLSDPVLNTVDPVGPYFPADPETAWPAETWLPEDTGGELVLLEVPESGYGIIPWVAGLFMAGLMARALT